MANKIAVFIGRFQPFHNGHLSIVSRVLKDFDQLIILIGSANRRVSTKNPFEAGVRKMLIKQTLADCGLVDKVIIDEVNDYLYSETKWETEIYYTVQKLLNGEVEDDDIKIVGYEKDDSSYYLHSFPQWRVVEYHAEIALDSTLIRESLYTAEITQDPDFKRLYTETVKKNTPSAVQKFMLDLPKLYENYRLDDVIADAEYYREEPLKFKDYPYPETLKFMCTDTVVLCKGHVLLIQRKFAPGRNTWALPGGFVGNKETFEQSALRELIEETSIKVPPRALQGKIKAAGQSAKTFKMFDDPARSLGIPRVTMAYCIEVDADPDGRLPRVKASDDALDAKWIPLAKANGMKLYDDHYDIIDYFTGSL